MNTVGRRGFLAGAAAVAGTGIVAADHGAATAAEQSGESASVPFHGRHQAGITTPAQRATAFVSFDTTADNRGELTDQLRTLTDRPCFLTTGGSPEALGITAPPSDSGTLGTDIPADRLTVTVGVGASLFDDRYGLTSRKPHRLTAMPTFPDDDLNDAWCHGDLSVQFCADSPDTVLHALRDITRHTRGGMQARWRMDGFVSPPRSTGTPRNHLGFKDGTANPSVRDARAMDRLVWVGADGGEPGWATGGSYQVVRLIRMLVEFWDRVSLTEQERMFGRARDTGAPLDGGHEKDTPSTPRTPRATSSRWTATSGWPTRARPPPTTSASCAAATTTTGAWTPTATSTWACCSAATSRIWPGSSRPCRSDWQANRWSTTSPRSAAATSSPCRERGMPPTGWDAPCWPDTARQYRSRTG